MAQKENAEDAKYNLCSAFSENYSALSALKKTYSSAGVSFFRKLLTTYCNMPPFL